MRVEFLQSIDFNQMLVYSTFVHLFFLMIIVFLPSPKIQEKIVVPTFKLDLIELSSIEKPLYTAIKKQKTITPIVKKSMALKPRLIAKKQERQEIKVLKPKLIAKKQKRQEIKVLKPKILSPLKPIIEESITNKKVLEDLEALQGSKPKKSILQKLDDIARVVPKPQNNKVVPPKLIHEETTSEIENKKKQTFPIKSEQVKVQPLLDNLGVDTKKHQLTDLFEEIDQAKKQSTASNLIKELEAIENKETLVDTSVRQKQTEKLNNTVSFDDVKPLASVAEKFKALEEISEEIKMDISQNQVVDQDFKTVIREGGIPAVEIDSKADKSNPMPDYVGEIYKRVYAKWKTPLASKFKKVVVTFTVFSKGSIDKPVIDESSGNENLDSIAVRAILDSVPFPMLPKELNRPNLRVSIIFKYVPEKK